MKKLSEFNYLETKNLIITLKSQLQIITNDGDFKALLSAYKEAKSGGEELEYEKIAYTLVDVLLVNNPDVLDIIVAEFMQMSIEELHDTNNIDVIKAVVDFLAIDTYRKLFMSAIQSGIDGQ